MDLTGKKVAILVTDYFEEIELISPRDALAEVGVTVEIVAPHGGQVQGVKHVDMGEKIAVDKTLSEASPEDYDAVVIPGGVVNADHLRMEEKARDFIRKVVGEEKPTAVICHGPWLLVSSGLARGKRLAAYYTLQDDIRNAGGEWIDEMVVQDGCLITSRNPDDLPAFNEALLKALGKQ